MEFHMNVNDMTLSYALHTISCMTALGKNAELCFDCLRHYGNACIKVIR